LTAEAVLAAIERGRPRNITGLAHGLGYSGSVGSSLTKKLRSLVPGIDSLFLKQGDASRASGGDPEADVTPVAKKPTAKAAKPKGGKWPRHAGNPFRVGSYATCFDILAAHPGGLTRERLVELLAAATGKDIQHAAFDAQVVLSARGAECPNLNPFEGPRNRSARFGYWVRRVNSHVELVLPAAPKEAP
jgi:hypothetical protein